MFICKKSLLILIALIVFAGASAGIFAGVAGAWAHAGERTIVIDAGHGGVDAGVRGKISGEKESDINLSIAKHLKGYLSGAGFNAVMTRTTQGGLYGTSTKGFKMRDMKKRKQVIEESSADMVVSIHQNFCPLPSKRGSHVFFDKTSEAGKLLADSIQHSLNALNGADGNTSLAGDYYMLKCTQNPSVIVECGFLSNSEDERLLCTDEYRKNIAYAVFRGIVAYYS